MLATLDAQDASQALLSPSRVPAGQNADNVKEPRRRGRSAKSDQSEAEIVEWWKPGWQSRSQ
jgi:hypothetical protein